MKLYISKTVPRASYCLVNGGVKWLKTEGFIMPYPRYKQIDSSQTPYYHLISRCVRRAYLCGIDFSTGESYEHRKGWVERRLAHLSEVFAIGVLAYAIMSNHTHLVVMIDQAKLDGMSDREVIRRWLKVSKGTKDLELFAEQGIFPQTEKGRNELRKLVREYRRRLTDISWFMKLLNEYIARKANKEDDCTGHFWEGRFKSQALLDFTAVISCMIYVDLNPFRAGVVDKPEHASFTSLKKRHLALNKNLQPTSLMPFCVNRSSSSPSHIDFSLHQYLNLINEASKPQKTNCLSGASRSILDKLELNPTSWKQAISGFEDLYPVAIGKLEKIESFKRATGRTRLKGAMNGLKLYQSYGLKPH